MIDGLFALNMIFITRERKGANDIKAQHEFDMLQAIYITILSGFYILQVSLNK